jgi:hypothetical protein
VGDQNGVRYQAKAARVHWRVLYIKCQGKNPLHKAEQGWLIDACKELFDVAKIKTLPGSLIQGDAWDVGDTANDIVLLEISRSALLGIKHAVIGFLRGHPPNQLPANNMDRQDLLDAVSGIGPDGTLRRMIEAEAKLDDIQIDEDKELGDLAPKKADETKK